MSTELVAGPRATGQSRLLLVLWFFAALAPVATALAQTARWNANPRPLPALAPVSACAVALDRPLRAIHIAGNWGTNRKTVAAWDPDNESLIPPDYIEYLKNLHVNWVGISVALHYSDSMDSTVERAYSSDLNVPTFSDDVLRQLIREFRENDFSVYLTLAFESHEARVSQRPVKRNLLGDPGDPATGVPHPPLSPPILPEFWPWRPTHPDHNRFVAEFWETYTQRAVHFAKIAQDEGVSMYSLGTETDRLFRTRSRGDYYVNDFDHELRSMVGSVRAVYEGLLTYDMHYSGVMFSITDLWYGWGWRFLWEDLDLDVVGVSAWFPLSESTPSEVMSVESLTEAYEKIFDDYVYPIAELNTGRPIVFTEYGSMDTVSAPAAPGATDRQRELMEHVDSNDNGVDDGRETQANVFQALFDTMDKHPGIVHGAFFWDNWIASDALWTEVFVYGVIRQ